MEGVGARGFGEVWGLILGRVGFWERLGGAEEGEVAGWGLGYFRLLVGGGRV